MRLCSLLSRCMWASLLLLMCVQWAFAQAKDIDLSEHYERIYQIRVVSQDAGGKSSIGSGFQVTADGLIVTNYHVVSEFVNAPELYNIDYVTHDGKSGQLELIDFDIISDLALLQHPEPAQDHLQLADFTPDKGEIAYALGNPGDWGIVMVPGPSNGLVEHSYIGRILFSGSLNAGMSGGPSLSREGKVIGVNVATAGSQLSFLVPVSKVKSLLSRKRHLKPNSFITELTAQIRSWQRPRIQELLAEPWAKEEFFGRPLFGEIRKDFQCWGDTNEKNKERKIEYITKSCRAGDDVFVSSDIDVGHIRFSFKNMKSAKLNDMQFSRTQAFYLSPDSRSNYENSTNFVCETDFIDGKTSNSKSYHRVITCVRAFKKLTGLYDSLLLVMNNSGKEVFKSYLSLSAMEKDQIQAMNLRFVRRTL